MERFTKAEEKIIKEFKEHMSPRLSPRHFHHHKHHQHKKQNDNEQNDNTSDKQKDNDSNKSASSSRSSSVSPSSRDRNQEKYLHDPIRNTKRPDHLGEFRDPIYQHQGSSICSSPDITNTGA